MVKKKKLSVYNDLRTGFFYKLCLLIGIFLLIFYIFLRIISLLDENVKNSLWIFYNLSKFSTIDSILAFSIILLGVGFIFYFIHLQFIKLSNIAKEIENEKKEKT
jgi:hypothetical protein